MVIRCEKNVVCVHMYAVTAKSGYSVVKSLLSRLVQEPSSYVVPGLRYEIIDTIICELILLLQANLGWVYSFSHKPSSFFSFQIKHYRNYRTYAQPLNKQS